MTLFDSGFLAKLEQLVLLARKASRSPLKAERKSRLAGSSLEFADYRDYAPGDDLRNLDWNIYGRLERMVIKIFEHEQDSPVHILVDTSASMRWQPEHSDSFSKLDCARRIAAAIAYIGLVNLDRVNIHWFNSDLGEQLGLCRGKAQFHNILQFLSALPAEHGETRLQTSMRSFTQRTRQQGLVFVVSDFLDPEGYQSAFSLLQAGRFEANAVHLVDPAEAEPPFAGDLELLDSESGQRLELNATETLKESYKQVFNAFLTDIAGYCARRAIPYALASTSIPFEDILLRLLRQAHLVK